MFRKKQPTTQPKRSEFTGDKLPVGACVLTPGDMFYMQEKSRLRIPSQAVLQSWSFPYVFLSSSEKLSKWPIMGKIGFRPGTVIYSLEDGLYYLIEKNQKRQITDPLWFDWMGIDRMNAVLASADDANLHKTGEVL